MSKSFQRKEPHNTGTHKEKMEKRRLLQRNRLSSLRPDRFITKYIPAEEDRKHFG